MGGRSAAIRQLIVRTELPSQIEQEIIAAYEKLTQGSGGPGCSLSVQSRVMVTAAGQTAGRLTESSIPTRIFWVGAADRVCKTLLGPAVDTAGSILPAAAGVSPLRCVAVVTVAKIPAKEAAIA